MDALRAIRARAGITAGDVERKLVETIEMMYVHCGWTYVPNGETIAAQMNLPYTAAVTLTGPALAGTLMVAPAFVPLLVLVAIHATRTSMSAALEPSSA